MENETLPAISRLNSVLKEGFKKQNRLLAIYSTIMFLLLLGLYVVILVLM